jgi:hypothetical protein
LGLKVIAKQINNIGSDSVRNKVAGELQLIENGARDFRF